MSTTYQELLDGVAQYYGSGSDQWAEIARYGVNQQTIPIIQQVPGVTVTVSNSGKYLGYDYSNPFAGTSNPASVIDSNVQVGAYGEGSFNAQLPATTVTDPSTGTVTMQSGSRVVSTGSTLATIADRASLAFVGVSLGTKLGKLIDSAIYSVDPDWWDNHYPTINPQTWDDIATTENGKNLIRSVFGLENDDVTMYLDERMLAYTYMMLLQNGAYSSGSTFVPETSKGIFSDVDNYIPFNISNGGQWKDTRGNTQIVTGNCVIAKFTTGKRIEIRWYSSSPGVLVGTFNGTNIYSGTTPFTHDGKSVYINSISPAYSVNWNAPYTVSFIDSGSDTLNSTQWNHVLWLALYGSETTSPISGINDNPQASEYVNPQALINPTTGQAVTPNDDPADVLQALKNQYPDLFNGSIYEDIPQSDGTTQRITYIPTPYPNTTNPTQPISDTTPGIDPQTNPEVNPDTRPQELIQQLIDKLTMDTTPPDTGDGDTPSAIIPQGTTNALYSVYNPTQAEINSFGAWLWSSNFVDQLLKLFNDPMQAIIGLHKVFAPPVISGTSTIKVGYLDSGVSSNVVGNQYTTVDCGYVNVSEYFGNVFDYDPFTQVYIYLPFVGIEKLDTGDVMRGRVGVKYHVDVLTGACLAEISVTRDGSGGILYTFAGNCAVQYPISSGSYMGIVASLASIAGGVVGTVMSGGALAPITMGAVNGALNAHTRVQHSGGFSGNAGAMGVKKPYLIITRPQTCLADDFPAFDGYPANKTTLLSECSGYIKCETCRVENIPATDAELSEIEMLLKGGIII